MFYNFIMVDELPLMIFTLLFQMSFGSVIVPILFSNKYGDSMDNNVKNNFLIAAILGVISLLAATTHLGNLSNAPYILTRLFDTPLPMEVTLASLFCLLSFIVYKKINNTFLHILTLIIGALAILFMTLAYSNMEDANPIWEFQYTLLSFITATFILGGIFSYCTILFLKEQGTLANKLFLNSYILGMTGVAIKLFYLPFYYIELKGFNAGGYDMLELIAQYGLQIKIFMILLFIGIAIWSLDVRARYNDEGEIIGNGIVGITLPFVALILLIIAMFFQRNLFYSFSNTMLF